MTSAHTNLLASTASVGLMLDIETLGTGPNAVVWQSALFGWDLKDPETLLDFPHFQYLPIQPQLDLFPAREVRANTLIYWMKQDDDARLAIANCDSNDFDDLPSLMRHFLRAFDRMTHDSEGNPIKYELWTRGNFDIPIMTSLLHQAGFEAPWQIDGAFRNLRDLRTLEAMSGVSYKDVAQPAGFIKHRADWDCRFQIAHHTACMKALGAAKAD